MQPVKHLNHGSKYTYILIQRLELHSAETEDLRYIVYVSSDFRCRQPFCSLHSFNGSDFATKMLCVFCDFRTELFTCFTLKQTPYLETKSCLSYLVAATKNIEQARVS
jgi:hypothetical protein